MKTIFLALATVAAIGCGGGDPDGMGMMVEPVPTPPDAGTAAPVFDANIPIDPPHFVRLTVFLKAFEGGVEVSACDLRVFDKYAGEVPMTKCYPDGLELGGTRMATGLFVTERVPVGETGVDQLRSLKVTKPDRAQIGPDTIYTLFEAAYKPPGIYVFINVMR